MGRHSHAVCVALALAIWRESGQYALVFPIETSPPMQAARHFGLNASCCGVGAPKTWHPLPNSTPIPT